MFSFIRKFLPLSVSSFVIEEVDHLRRVVVLEDKQLSLRIEIPIGENPLKTAEIVEPYTILLTFEDGSKTKKRILN